MTPYDDHHDNTNIKKDLMLAC